jgi:tricarballylate dehydrogenase
VGRTEERDVVVVGAGNAALVAALAAHECGAEVLVLEAAPVEERGGNSRFAGGIFRCSHDGMDDLAPLLTDEAQRWRDRVLVAPYTTEDFRRDLDTTSAGRNDDALSARLVAESTETLRWMRDRGVEWELTVGKLVDPENISPDDPYVLPPGGAVRSVREGVGLMDRLFEAVESVGIEVWYSAPATTLLTDGATVHGLRVARDDGDVEVRGQVVLASGGFEANPEMRLRYLGDGWDLVKVRGSRFNMGTMLSEAMRAGAQPFGHWGGCHASPLDADAPPVGDLALTDKMSRYSYPYWLLFNFDAERFVDEGEAEVWLTYAKTGDAIRRQPRALAFQLFDRKTVHLLEPRYATGTPVEADTIEQLAEQLGLDPRRLRATVDRFNAATPQGTFDPFSEDGLATRGVDPPKSNWAQPLDEPPFTAYRVTCGITFTYGGVRIDEHARVIDTAGRQMPGLFATGEIAGGFFFHNYPGGAGLTRGAVFGRIAGAAAAARAASTAR